eukprot:jgi/Ulvmu1/5433/UM022_0228.1
MASLRCLGNGPSDAFKAALVSLQRKATQLEEQLATSEQGKASLDHEITVSKGDLARAHTEISMLMDRNRSLEGRQTARVESLQKENKNAQDTLAELLRDKAEQQNKLRLIDHECCQLRASLDAAQRELRTSTSTQQSMTSRVQCAEQQKSQIEDRMQSLQDLNERLTGQLRDYEVVSKDRLNQCQHQATKIRDLETKLAVTSADLDAAGKQAHAMQKQAVQAMDVRHTMEQMKQVMKQQHTAQHKLEEETRCSLQLRQQLECAEAQLKEQTEQLQETQAQLRMLRCQSAEEAGVADLRIRALESQIADAHQCARMACCTASQRLAGGDVRSACAALSERTVAHQLQASSSRAEQATQDLRAREEDIRVLQQCLEAERKDKECVQQTLASVLKMHNDIHMHLVEVGPQDVKAANKAGRGKKVSRDVIKDVLSSPTAGLRRKAMFTALSPCAQATAVATSIKARNQLAVKSHVRRQKSDTAADARDDSTSSRIARCAASGVTQAAEKAFGKQAKQERKALEMDYLNQYKLYKQVSEALRDSKGSDAPEAPQLRQQLVSVADTMNAQATRLIGGCHGPQPWHKTEDCR